MNESKQPPVDLDRLFNGEIIIDAQYRIRGNESRTARAHFCTIGRHIGQREIAVFFLGVRQLEGRPIDVTTIERDILKLDRQIGGRGVDAA